MLYLTLRQYEYVVAIAEMGSLSRAAQRLNVSQPAISVALRTVEDQLGQRLFHRGRGSGLRTTPSAHRFLAEARALLQAAHNLETGRAGQPTLRLGCFTDLAPSWQAPTLRRLRRALPDVEVSLQVAGFADLATGLHEGTLDLALTYDLGLDPDLHRTELARHTPGAYVSAVHPLSGQKQVSLSRLASFPLALCEEGLSIQHMISLFTTRGLTPMIAHRVAGLEVMRSFAANGEGVGISYADPPGDTSYDGRRVVRVPISDAGVAEPVVLVSTTPSDRSEVATNALKVLQG